MTKQKIIQVVEQLIETHETKDPFLLAKRLGIEIRYDILGTLQGLMLVDKRVPCIVLNVDSHELVQRATCAHELGHYVLGHESNRFFLSAHTFQRTNTFEIEAQTFASELLIRDEDECEPFYLGCSEEHVLYIIDELVRLKRE